MQQSKLESLMEVCTKTFFGFILAMLLWILVIEPLWGWNIPLIENFYITGIFTIKSIIFGYFWRRIHNAGYNRRVYLWTQHQLKTLNSWYKELGI